MKHIYDVKACKMGRKHFHSLSLNFNAYVANVEIKLSCKFQQEITNK